MIARTLLLASLMLLGALVVGGTETLSVDGPTFVSPVAAEDSDTCEGWPAEKVVRKVFDECPHGPVP